jgi:hypothetical protein
LLTEALALAARGFRVFPCHTMRGDAGKLHCSCARSDCGSPGKHPRTLKGLLEATTDEATIRAWWAKWPDANIAVRTGDGLVVLDVDPRKDGTSNGLDLPETLRVVTGGLGEHWYMQGSDVPNSVELIGPGLDVRGDGGYVLAPPSMHASGRRYEWDSGGGDTVAAAPQWFLSVAKQRRLKAVPAGVEEPGAFIAGGRNDALTAMAGSMRRRGFGAPAMVAALISENASKCRPPLDEPEVRRIAEGVAKRYQPSDPVKAGWSVLGWDALSTQLPPIPWLCKELGLAPGAPAMVAGYGFSGKTVSLQAMAIAVASGGKAWGRFEVGSGSVLHVDYEQGRHLTQARYQRLAVAAGVWSELAGRLEVVSLPPVHLDADGAIEKLKGLCEGKRLCIIDSLKAAFPTADENSSDVRKWLDQLLAVSESTGCVIVVIHHARKPQKDAQGGAKTAIRGSGAIFDACASILVFEGAKTGPTLVSHEKARITGKTVEDFELSIADVSLPEEALSEAARAVMLGDGMANESGLVRYGLKVVAGDAESKSAPATSSRALETKLFALIENAPGLGKRRLRELVGGRAGSVDDALGLLLEDGRVFTKLGPNRMQAFFPAELD